MKRSILQAATLATIGLCAIHQSVQAHGAWMSKIHGDYHVMWGHDPSKTESYNPADVLEARAIKNGQTSTLQVNRAQKFASVDAGDAGIVAATMGGGFSTKTADGKYHRLPKDEAAKLGEVQTSAFRTRYVVAYANNREEPKLMGYDLELLPESNPARLKKGEKISVQVLFKGKPLADATINDNFLSQPRQMVKTDAQGKATLTVANYGHNTWSVSHSIPYADPSKADTTSYTTNVSFMVPGAESAH